MTSSRLQALERTGLQLFAALTRYDVTERSPPADGLYVTVGAGQVVSADQRVPSAATRFTIVVQGGGALRDGAKVALQTADKSQFLTAGANNTLDASGTSVGLAQTFKLGY